MKKLFSAGSMFLSMCLFFALGGCKGGGGGDNPGAAAPSVPTDVRATEGNRKDRVEITWGAVVEADSYVIYKSIDNKNQFRAIATGVAEASYTDAGVTPNRMYYYRVAAANGSVWSQPSEPPVLGYAHTGP
ncbi:MAG TPA: fibronectin type III domain-containing protein, partial [Spirochaetota bacterium]|nr:fibronectin type III domain-containing protein [Spirochaetota bacterium]